MSALASVKTEASPSVVLFKAFNRACEELGVSKTLASKIIGVNRATLSRKEANGLDPKSKQGELSLHFVRLYRSLFAISGGDNGFMKHWFTTKNVALGAAPVDLVTTVLGLIQTNEDLNAMRGKI